MASQYRTAWLTVRIQAKVDSPEHRRWMFRWAQGALHNPESYWDVATS